MSRRTDQLTLAELREVRADVRDVDGRVQSRLDSMSARPDTVVDPIAGLRRDFDQHTHEA